MATYYIDPNWTGTKSGTFAAPYSLYSSLPALSAGDFVLQKEGTTATENVAAGYSGTNGNPITYGVYSAATGAQIATTLGAATIAGVPAGAIYNFSTGGQSFVEAVGFRFSRIKDSGSYGCRLGSNSSGNTDGNAARYCVVENETCAAGFLLFSNLGVAGHTIDHCVSSYNSAYGILQTGTGGAGKINVTNNTCNYNAEAGFRSAFSTAILVSGINAGNQFAYNGTLQAVVGKGIGIDVVADSRGLVTRNNDCRYNYTMGIRMGNLSGTASSNGHTAIANNCSYNGEHGLQVVNGGGWIVSGNKCNYNGANRGKYYGRGIELYGGSTTPVGPGVVCYNECSYNFNYGGTSNNGTEGGGIGLDDYHTGISVFGNRIVGNEGNGIQYNPNGAAGINRVFGNTLVDNFAAPVSRSSGWSDYVKAQMCTYGTENNVRIHNNTIILTSQSAAPSCLYGISENNIAAGTGTSVCNNIIQGHGVGLKVRTGITRTNNSFYNNTKNVESNADTTTLSDGTAAQTVDPGLDAAFAPTHAAVIAGGTYLGGADYYGREFPATPAIGAVQPRAARTVTTRVTRNH